jgi:general secretion pathway protein E
LDGLKQFAAADSGMMIISGPAGSGKTTTIYAMLQHIAANSPGLSIITLEDPVERDLPGVTQIEVSAFGQLTYERALRSVLRQDPQVLMLGEIRDVQTASLAVQAALAGHRMICTLHAATPGGAIARLLEMGLEPYRITSTLHGVMAQRLLRRLADNEGGLPASSKSQMSSELPSVTKYRGRLPIAEFLGISPELRAGILDHADAAALQKIAAKLEGYSSLRDSADSLVAQHLTTAEEVERVLGAIAQT